MPEVDLAEAAGLKFDNGIHVDARLAIGDCCAIPHMASGRHQRLELFQNVTDQARAVTRTISSTETVIEVVPWFWSDIGSAELQITGVEEGCDRTHAINDPVTGAPRAVCHQMGGRHVAFETLSCAGEHILARKILAAGKAPDPAMIATGDVKAMKAWVMT